VNFLGVFQLKIIIFLHAITEYVCDYFKLYCILKYEKKISFDILQRNLSKSAFNLDELSTCPLSLRHEACTIRGIQHKYASIFLQDMDTRIEPLKALAIETGVSIFDCR